MKFKYITNTEDGLLSYENTAIKEAFKNKDPDFKRLSEEMLISIELLENLYDLSQRD